MNTKELFEGVDTVMVIDWPDKEVPELLARAGFKVVVRGGPGPADYSVYEVNKGEVVTRYLGRSPESADLIYSYRPFRELGEIIATAQRLRARTVWTQSGLAADGSKDPKGCWLPAQELQLGQDLARAAGLNYVTQPYIGDVAREI